MNIFYLCLLLTIPVLNVVKSQRNFYEINKTVNIREVKPVNEKVYFPGKTNEDEVNLKRINNGISNSFRNEPHTNRLNNEDRPVIRDTSIVINIREVIPARKASSTNSITNSLNDNSSPSLVKRVIDRIRNSSEESGEKRAITSSSSNRRNPTRTSSEEIEKNALETIVSVASSLLNLRVCEIKYAEYIQRIFPQEDDTAKDANDAEFNGRVLASPGEYPHMTALGFRSKNGKVDYKCGGSLISETFVITAAHCVNFTGQQPTKVRIGDLNLMIEESFLEPQIRNIRNIFVHPDYRTDSYYNDIALLELTEEVELTEFVRPIRLWTQPTIPFTTAHAMGYGATDFARQRTNRLTDLNMTIISNADCNREMPKMPETNRGIIASQICARDFELNRDTCQGDSGGPLQLNIRGRRRTNRLHYQLIGITSYGLYCRSGYPSIFTRVYSYLDWIEHIVWKDSFK
ncbi:serine protease snake [Lucilia sericata]|uniref:serine protease snake n=1 Tax=Lucilia sericata TaxID=13632 RepID=UPI0018A81281|nr:serine protease snake [Lucilia sericata]